MSHQANFTRAALIIVALLTASAVGSALGSHRAAAEAAKLCTNPDWLARQDQAAPVPEDPLEYLPIPPNGEVVSSEVRRFPTNVPAIDQTLPIVTLVSLVVEAPGTRSELAAFYGETLVAQGWCLAPPDPQAANQLGGGGYRGTVYCRTLQGPAVHLVGSRAGEQGAIGLRIHSPASRECGRFGPPAL
jgi:hypothetical protein